MRPRQYSDEEILSAARACLIAHGPGVSTKQIAEAVGVSQATLFKRFGTKDDLLFAALRPPMRPPILERLAAGPGPDDLRAQLVEICQEMLRFFSEMMPRLATLRAAGLEDRLRSMRAQMADDLFPPIRARRLLRGWLAAARDEGRLGDLDPDTLALALLGALQMLPLRKHMLQDDVPPTDAYVERLIHALWDGIAPREVEP